VWRFPAIRCGPLSPDVPPPVYVGHERTDASVGGSFCRREFSLAFTESVSPRVVGGSVLKPNFIWKTRTPAIVDRGTAW